MRILHTLFSGFMASSDYSPEQVEHVSLSILREIIYRVASISLPLAVGASMIFSWYNVQRELAIVEGVLLTLLLANACLVFFNNSRIFSNLTFCFVIIFFLSAPIVLGFSDFIYFCLVYPAVFYILISRRQALILNLVWLAACTFFAVINLTVAQSVIYSFAHLAIWIFTETLFSLLACNEKELKQLSIRDPLTGAYNRRAMKGFLENAIMIFDRYNAVSSVIMLDIDHFKQINDTYGHKEGDQVLKQITELLRGRIRATDSLCRYGGEEFVLILNNTDSQQALETAEAIRKQVKNSIVTSKQRITISCGVVQTQQGDSVSSWLHRGDMALYRAKQSGRDRVEADGEQFRDVERQRQSEQ